MPNNRFGIHNKSFFEYTYCDWYFQKTKYKQSARKDQTDGSSSSKNSSAEVAAAGKNPDTHEQRSAADVNKFEQRPEEIKFESSAVAAKPKKVDVTTEAQMDARIARKQENRRQKKKMLVLKLRENTDEINKVKDFAKKQETALQI